MASMILPCGRLPSMAAVCSALLFTHCLQSLCGASTAALAAAPIPKQKWIVGVSSAPPFDLQNPDGSWTGISVELWREIAQELNLDYELRETNPAGRFDGLREGWLDISVGPLAITAQREEICDFTHAYFISGLGVALPTKRVKGNLVFYSGLLSGDLWRRISRVVLALLAALGTVAGLIWLCERRVNASQFGRGDPVRGLGSSLWWAAVTMTTVGYGDVSPRTCKGRMVAVLWMFVSLVIVSVFTATMASILTAERLSGSVVIHDAADLRHLRVGTIPVATTEDVLRTYNVDFKTFPPGQLLEALRSGKVDAVVNDEPILRYLVRTHYRDEFTVLPLRLDRELYAFALREDSPLRASINRVLLRKIHEPAWQKLVYQYLGNTPGY
ncbi:MAG: transporter substrate-binding domain-containing protein [Verrucomicrobia bacterium]|nr:transporter substrate-binding domain-containing protein [Verrucomicrobiota bacterium]